MNRISLFGVQIDVLTLAEAVQVIADDVQTSERCRFVVTPNLDHAVLLDSHEKLKAAYEEADLVLADGWPVVLASRLFRRPLPERVAGSDLVPALFDDCQARGQALTVFLLGAAAGVADRAAEKIQERWPVVRIVGTNSPPKGFEHDEAASREIVARINQAHPDLLIVGLGAPKQELWVHEHFRNISAGWALCVGATIDFLAEEKARARRWMQRMYLEWAFRLGSEPRRLFKRYLLDAFAFPRLLSMEWISSRGSKKRPASDPANSLTRP